MARRPPPGKCVHCLKDGLERTWDHVFPESWYPKTTGANIEKWKIPACESCNKEYGVLEQDLMLRLGLCIDPNAFESTGVVPKVLRSLDPKLAKNDKDRRAREAKRDQILKQVLKGTDIPLSAVYPRFEERWGRPPENQVAVPLPKKSVDRLFEKVIRGLAYLENGCFIEPPHTVALYPLGENDTPVFTSLLDKFGKVHARGPGIVVRRAVAPEDGLSAIYEITIWGMFQTYAVVLGSEPNPSPNADAREQAARAG